MNRTASIPIILIICIFLALGAESSAIVTLDNLDPVTNKLVKIIRDDVRKSIYVIKSGRSEHDLPQLQFYQYRVGKDDSFWTILSKASLDIDTLMTVNDLSSPKEVSPGRIIFIPNMRGTLVKVTSEEGVNSILRANGIAQRYVNRINSFNRLGRKYLFIPCGKVTNLERSLFLGIGFVNPLLSGKKSSGFGTRRDPFNSRRLEFHSGIDVACVPKSRIHAARDGKVVFSGFRGNYGRLVVIEHEHGYESYYGHLSGSSVSPGQLVKRGDFIGFSGNTGRSTGPHLHFEVRKKNRPVNPGILLAQ